ncbi:elongation factor G-like protein EF-G2 [Blastococcus sp. CT_GayMR16]|uniref:elongation factor G-like protein EF-G2 n=1 Tax=Blastococcus sp. CT_GayMR16 TaxID=2559607 RepID=UPI001073006C|nr:elongation factor G-like protein EF-G2 [Blastococcus sp. CT_GayMR16]TFV85823.1 elongation factor G-like protein EF-G2 [Blastococcus sp. CT_GayMR16]
MAKDTATAPAPRPAGKVRNVALVGHAGSGKTTLAEALLVATGALPRAGRVEDGTTCLDTEDVEVRQQRSVSLGVATVEHDGHRITLLDTPGSPDFVGELRAGLRAADAALFVVSAVNGVDATTVQLWEECAAVGMPRAVVITQLDRARADVDDAVRMCQRMLGEGVFPLHLLERGPDGAVRSLVSLLEPHPEANTAAVDADRLRGELIEGIIGESEDETLMDRYLAGEELVVADLVSDLETAVARGHFHPVLCVAPLSGVGVPELLDLLVSAFPCPMEHGCPTVYRPNGSAAPPLTCDPDGPLVAEVVKTTTDPYLGRVSLVRVFSGTLRPDTPVHVSGHGLADRGHPDHDVDERVSAISSPLGATLRPVAACPAGDICALARLVSAETGDTLSSPEDPRVVLPWELPVPQLPVAVEAASRADEDRLATALARLVAEDPTVRLERRPDTGQLLLWCVGEAHAEVLLERLRTRHGVAVNTVPVRVPMVETLAGSARVTGRHVKQSGGHGQYAVVVVEAEPGAPGSGVVFEQKIVGGTVPSQFHGSVEKGIRTQAERGISGDRPLVDVRLTLVDGKSHSVDSSDAAFQAAGALALRELAAAAGTRVLEPWCEVQVVVPAEFVGAVMSDLSGRRARVTGSEADPSRDRTTVRAEVPEIELLTYPGVLRSVTHGTGSFSRSPLGYEAAPASVAVPA